MTERSKAMANRMRALIRRAKPNCHICGKPINYELTWPDPMCFVVDHLVPLAKGGADNVANARAAHATCNSTKRARDYAPIIRRSGFLE
uniref:HNH endonuclease n=1 Tax=Microbacterium sp. LWH11-1.2 TaxID=3135258 RepID=UPI00406D0655